MQNHPYKNELYLDLFPCKRLRLHYISLKRKKEDKGISKNRLLQVGFCFVCSPVVFHYFYKRNWTFDVFFPILISSLRFNRLQVPMLTTPKPSKVTENRVVFEKFSVFPKSYGKTNKMLGERECV